MLKYEQRFCSLTIEFGGNTMEADIKEEIHKPAKPQLHSNCDDGNSGEGYGKYIIIIASVVVFVMAFVFIILGLLIWHSEVSKNEASNDKHERAEETQRNIAIRAETQ